nr:hypothetical protein [Candidatus Omnitrophota bacterium]
KPMLDWQGKRWLKVLSIALIIAFLTYDISWATDFSPISLSSITPGFFPKITDFISTHIFKKTQEKDNSEETEVFFRTQLVPKKEYASRSIFKNKKVDYDAITTQNESNINNIKDTLSHKRIQANDNGSLHRKDISNLIKASYIKDIANIYINDTLGKVIDSYVAPDSKGTIIHIQDLHTNSEASINLAGILEILLKDYDLGLVCSEGASGVVDTSSVSSFPDSKIREKVAKVFVNSGELTGEEYLSITKYPDLPIWGIEDKDLYFQHIIEFNKIMKFSPDALTFINQVKVALDKLKPKIYSKELLDLDSKEIEYQESKLDTTKYLDYLLCSRPGLDISNYKNIAIFKDSLEAEKTIDQSKIIKESQDILSNLQTILKEKDNKSEIKSLSIKAGLFKDKKISPFSFYSYLDELARRHLKEDLGNYPDFINFVSYLKKINSLDSTKLFNEIEELTTDVKDFISDNDNQKLLTKSLRNIRFLENFFNLKISNEELEYYFKGKESFKVTFFESFLKENLKKYNIDSFIDFNADLIDKNLPELEAFYEIAHKRDLALFDNAIAEIEKRKVKTSSIIAGGFHTQGITDLLKEQGYSYVVVSPYSKTQIDEENYRDLLAGKRKPLSELLTGLNNTLRMLMGFAPEEFRISLNVQVRPILEALSIPFTEIDPLSPKIIAAYGLATAGLRIDKANIEAMFLEEFRSHLKGPVVIRRDTAGNIVVKYEKEYVGQMAADKKIVSGQEAEAIFEAAVKEIITITSSVKFAGADEQVPAQVEEKVFLAERIESRPVRLPSSGATPMPDLSGVQEDTGPKDILAGTDKLPVAIEIPVGGVEGRRETEQPLSLSEIPYAGVPVRVEGVSVHKMVPMIGTDLDTDLEPQKPPVQYIVAESKMELMLAPPHELMLMPRPSRVLSVIPHAEEKASEEVIAIQAAKKIAKQTIIEARKARTRQEKIELLNSNGIAVTDSLLEYSIIALNKIVFLMDKGIFEIDEQGNIAKGPSSLLKYSRSTLEIRFNVLARYGLELNTATVRYTTDNELIKARVERDIKRYAKRLVKFSNEPKAVDKLSNIINSSDGSQIVNKLLKITPSKLTKDEKKVIIGIKKGISVALLAPIAQPVVVPAVEAQKEELREQVPAPAVVATPLISTPKTWDELIEDFKNALLKAEGRTLRGSQINGALEALKGNIIAMDTSGGKSILLRLAAYLDSMANDKNNVQPYCMTTSDYLAQRDGEEAARQLGMLGKKVGVVLFEGNKGLLYHYDADGKFITEEVSPEKVWQEADIVYGTKASFIFTLERELFAGYGYVQPLLSKQHNLFIDEVDRPAIEELSESHQLQGDEASGEDVENIQRTVNEIAYKWHQDNRGDLREVSRQEVKLLTGGKQELQREETVIKALKGKKGLEREVLIMKYEFYMTIALEAYECYHEGEKAGLGIYIKGKRKVGEREENDIVIIDEAQGEQKPGSEWQEGLHNAIRLKEGYDWKKEHLNLIAMPITSLLAKKGEECSIKTADRKTPLIGTWTGATGTDAEEAMRQIYGIETVHLPSEVTAWRIEEEIIKGIGVILHAQTMPEAEKLKAELDSFRGEIPHLKGNIDIVNLNDGNIETTINDAIENQRVIIVITETNAVTDKLREITAREVLNKKLALIGRLVFRPYVYRSHESRWFAGLSKIASVSKEVDEASNKLRTVIARLGSIEDVEKAKQDLKNLHGVSIDDIVIINAKEIKTPEDLTNILEEKVFGTKANPIKPGKVVLVAGNMLNRGANTRLLEVIQEQEAGAWIVGVNMYFDKLAAEEIQYMGRFGRAGDAAEWFNYYSVDDLLGMVSREMEGYNVLMGLKNGEVGEPLDEKDTSKLFEEIREMNFKQTISLAEEQMKFEELLHMGVARLDGKPIWEWYFDARENVRIDKDGRIKALVEAIKEGRISLKTALEGLGFRFNDQPAAMTELANFEKQIKEKELDEGIKFIVTLILNRQDRAWQELYTGMSRFRNFSRVLGWERQASQYDLFMDYTVTLIDQLGVKESRKETVINIAKGGFFVGMAAVIMYLIMPLLNIKTVLGFFSSASILVAANPVFLGVIGFAAIFGVLASLALGPYLKQIEIWDKSKQAPAFSLAGIKAKGLNRMFVKYWIQQVLNLANRLLLVTSGIGILTIAGSGALLLLGLPINLPATSMLLCAIGLVSILGLVSRLTTIAINRDIIKSAPVVTLKPYQRFMDSFTKGFLFTVSFLFALQIPGIGVFIGLAGILAGFAAHRYVISKTGHHMVDTKAQKLGYIASAISVAAAVLGLTPAISLLANSIWVVIFISALIFGISGIVTFTANIVLAKKSTVIRAAFLSKEQKSGIEAILGGFKFFFRQVMFNPVAIGQALFGLAGVIAAVNNIGGAVPAVIVLGISIVSIVTGIAVALIGYSIYRIVSRPILNRKFDVAMEKFKSERKDLTDIITGISIKFKNWSKEDKLSKGPLNAIVETLKSKKEAGQLFSELPDAVILTALLDYMSSSRAPPPVNRKYLAGDAKAIIKDTLTKLKNEKKIDEDEIKNLTALLLGLFRKLNLIATPLDRLKYFLSKPESWIELSQLGTSFSIIMPTAIGIVSIQQRETTDIEETVRTQGMRGNLLYSAADNFLRTFTKPIGAAAQGLPLAVPTATPTATPTASPTAAPTTVQQATPVAPTATPDTIRGTTPRIDINQSQHINLGDGTGISLNPNDELVLRVTFLEDTPFTIALNDTETDTRSAFYNPMLGQIYK